MADKILVSQNSYDALEEIVKKFYDGTEKSIEDILGSFRAPNLDISQVLHLYARVQRLIGNRVIKISHDGKITDLIDGTTL